MSTVSGFCRTIAESRWFNNFILIVILGAGVVVGIETYGEQVSHLKPLLWTLDQIILFIFLVEVIIKMTAEGNRPWRYFNDPWNIFDFSIVAVCYAALLMPEVDGAYVAVFRLARVMRVFRVVRAVPKLQLLVNTLLKSIPSIGYIAILLGILFYIYAVMGVFLFKDNDPVHFGNLQYSLLSLFRVVTLDDWTNIMYINMYGCDHPIWGYGPENDCTSPAAFGFGAAFYFVSFVLVGTMIVLNLFIGVIMNSMEEAKEDVRLRDEAEAKENTEEDSLEQELAHMSKELESMKKRVDSLAGKNGSNTRRKMHLK